MCTTIMTTNGDNQYFMFWYTDLPIVELQLTNYNLTHLHWTDYYFIDTRKRSVVPSNLKWKFLNLARRFQAGPTVSWLLVLFLLMKLKWNDHVLKFTLSEWRFRYATCSIWVDVNVNDDGRSNRRKQLGSERWLNYYTRD